MYSSPVSQLMSRLLLWESSSPVKAAIHVVVKAYDRLYGLIGLLSFFSQDACFVRLLEGVENLSVRRALPVASGPVTAVMAYVEWPVPCRSLRLRSMEVFVWIGIDPSAVQIVCNAVREGGGMGGICSACHKGECGNDEVKKCFFMFRVLLCISKYIETQEKKICYFC